MNIIKTYYHSITTIPFSEHALPSKKPKATDDETVSTSGHSGKYVLKSLPKTFLKNKDHDIPLPNPFPLPKNYRSDVTAALETGQMTHETENALLSAVASSIFKYKKIPTKEDYVDVATCIMDYNRLSNRLKE